MKGETEIFKMQKISFNNSSSFSGKTSSEKVKEVREKMEEKNASVYVVTALDDVACEWEINISHLS